MSTKSVPAVESGPVKVEINSEESGTLLERAKELYHSVANRAYELFEGRGHSDGGDLEDWLQAERELLFPVPVEVTDHSESLRVRAELPGFRQSDLQVNLEPFRLVISGRMDNVDRENLGETAWTTQRSSEIFHVNLPSEVDPAKATAKLAGGVLEIQMPKRD